MTTTIVSTTINHGIQAGYGNYGTPLTITNSGAVNGITYGVAALFSSSIVNAGHINAADDGVLMHSGNLDNSGSIHGQIGVGLLNGGFINTGVINGSSIGVVVDYNLQVANNYGVITGGTSGVIVELGSFTNEAGGTVSGNAKFGVAGADAYMRNNGLVTGLAAGAALYGEGAFYNSGVINGLGTGFYLQDTLTATTIGAVLDNGGVITAYNYGANVTGGDALNSGTLYGGKDGVILSSGTLLNTGVITGGTFGASLSSSDLLNIGYITGSAGGVYLSSGSFINEGNIHSTGIGVSLGAVQASNSGTIGGGQVGVRLAGGTLYDSGGISGSQYAVEASAGLNLVVSAGAMFGGTVQARSAGSGSYGTLVLGGTLSGYLAMGGSFSGFKQIDFTGGEWTLEGEANDLAAGQTITGFGVDDAIQLHGFTATSHSFESGTGLVLSNGTAQETLALAGSFSTSDFTVSDNVYGAVVSLDTTAPCFCAGTRIAAAHGDVAVEELAIGDLVRTAAHGLQPIRWIGRRSYEGRFIAGNHLALPVQIRAHALGVNVPSRDLLISPDHALAEGGVLVHAWRFINGVSITQAQSVERVEYFHIELDSHAVIFAENTPVESFLDAGCRGRFQNASSAPADLAPQEAFLPRVEDGYYLARLKARIDARAGITAPTATGILRGCIDEAGTLLRGWAQDAAAPEAPVELELVCAGQIVQRFLANRYRADLRTAGLGSGCHAFELALPVLDGPLTLRRVADGAVLDQGWMATRRAG